MKNILKAVLVVAAIIFITIQFYRPSRVNPPVGESESIRADQTIPSEVQTVLARSCRDCHSNETVYPWYSNVTPFNWFLDGHIRQGREELNLSNWGTLDAASRAHKAEEMCEQVSEGNMPLPSYLWIHRDAVLRPGDAELICRWSRASTP